MTANIYDTFDKAFSKVNAYALLHDGAPIGRLCVKHGEGTSTAFLQIWGARMVKARSRGYGYDRRGAACASAIEAARAMFAAEGARNLIGAALLLAVDADLLVNVRAGAGFATLTRALGDVGLKVALVV